MYTIITHIFQYITILLFIYNFDVPNLMIFILLLIYFKFFNLLYVILIVIYMYMNSNL